MYNETNSVFMLSLLFSIMMALLITQMPKFQFSFFGMMEDGAKLFEKLIPPVLVQKNELGEGVGGELLKELKGAEQRLRDALNEQNSEIKKHGETSLQTLKDIKAAEKRLEDIEAKMGDSQKQLNELEASTKRFGAGRAERKTIGQQVTESQAFKDFAEKKTNKAVVQLERKALTIDSTLTGNAGVGQIIVPQRLPGLITPAQNQVHIRDLILGGQMQNNTVQYLEEKWFFPVATELSAPEAAAQTVLSVKSVVGFFVGQTIFITDGTNIEKRVISAVGASDITVSSAITNAYAVDSLVGSYQITGTAPTTQKPQGVWKTDLKTETDKTIAFFFKIAKQTLDDVPQLLSMIDARALEGLLNAEDWQLLFGNGAGQNLNGIFSRASLYNRTTGGDTKLDVLRRATTQLRLQEAYATMAVLSPEDWESIELIKGTDARYVWVNVNDGGVPRLWRMPIVDTTLMPANSWMIGDGNQAQIFDRQSATIELFEQDDKNVQQNLITVRVEERLALANYRPTSFVKGTSW